MSSRTVSVVPFTISGVKQCIYNTTTGVITTTWGQSLNMIKIIACIESIRVVDGLEFIVLNDSTGSLAVLHYSDNRDETDLNVLSLTQSVELKSSSSNIAVNQYVAVHGTICFMERERGNPASHFHLDAKHIRPLQDFNELTMHMLDAIHTNIVGMRK